MNRDQGDENGAGRRKVLVLAPQPFYEDRGTPMAIRELVTAFGRLGYHVDMVSFPVGRDVAIPDVRHIRTANPLRFRHIPIGFTFRKVFLDVLLFVRAYGLLRRHRYFSVHGVEEGAFLALALGRRFGVPVVYEMQSSLPQQLAAHSIFRPRPIQRVLRACERWLLRRVDMVACSSGLGEYAREIAPEVPVQEWRYPLLDRTVDEGEIARLKEALGIGRNAFIAAYTGTFESYQGLDEIIAATPRAATEIPGLTIVMVGAQPADATRLQQLADRSGVRDRIRILPRRSAEEIPGFHAMADVLLAPRAAGSNLPLKVFHYMGAARPILATGSAPDGGVLGDGRALVVPHSADGIAAGLVRLHSEPHVAAGMVREARAYADASLGAQEFEASVQAVCERFETPAAARARVRV